MQQFASRFFVSSCFQTFTSSRAQQPGKRSFEALELTLYVTAPQTDDKRVVINVMSATAVEWDIRRDASVIRPAITTVEIIRPRVRATGLKLMRIGLPAYVRVQPRKCLFTLANRLYRTFAGHATLYSAAIQILIRWKDSNGMFMKTSRAGARACVRVNVGYVITLLPVDKRPIRIIIIMTGCKIYKYARVRGNRINGNLNIQAAVLIEASGCISLWSNNSASSCHTSAPCINFHTCDSVWRSTDEKAMQLSAVGLLLSILTIDMWMLPDLRQQSDFPTFVIPVRLHFVNRTKIISSLYSPTLLYISRASSSAYARKYDALSVISPPPSDSHRRPKRISVFATYTLAGFSFNTESQTKLTECFFARVAQQ